MVRWIVGAAVALAMGSQAPALAQEPAEASLAEQADAVDARTRFYTGAQLYQEGNYEGALVEFRESYRLQPVPVATFNVAQALRALHRYHEAAQQFRRYLREGGDSIPDDRRASVERTIRALERRIAPITLRVEPAGAEIRVDGRRVGIAPLREPLLLGVGRRVIEITADGYVPLRDELEVVGRQPRTVPIRLARRETAGAIRITTRPEHAHLRVDGLAVGRAPLERRVPAGGHVIEAELPGYETYRASVELAPRQQLTLTAVLEEDTGPGLTGQWWFWAGVSAIAVGAAAAIVLATLSAEPDPVRGSSYDGVIAVLRSP
jgi:hypothetical protein